MDDLTFQSHFRLTKKTYEVIIIKIIPLFIRENNFTNDVAKKFRARTYAHIYTQCQVYYMYITISIMNEFFS